jgi:hypothetical protein
MAQTLGDKLLLLLLLHAAGCPRKRSHKQWQDTFDQLMM